MLERACELAPSEGRYQLILGKVLRDNGSPEAAVMHLRMAYETGDEPIQAEAEKLLGLLGAPKAPEPKPRPAGKLAPPAEPAAKAPSKAAGSPAHKAAVENADDKTLYERLGGKDAIKAVVDEFVSRVGADKRINSFFATADLGALKGQLVDQIGQAAGGPEVYKGRSMKQVHAGMGVKSEHFDALVEDLVGTLDKFKVPEKEKGELLSVLGPMKSDIVE